jgi:hypothetical protein
MQGLKKPFVERNIMKLASQQAQFCDEGCNYEGVMEYVPRQRIAGSDLVALTLRGDSK